MNLLIDMGNSRLKWGMQKDNNLIVGLPIVYGENLNQQLALLWQDIGTPHSIAIACVKANEWLEIVQKLLTTVWLDSEIKIVTPLAKAYGVTIVYQSPEKLGVDRWLGMLATYHNFPKNDCCIVDCGTAVTIDLLNREGQHLGGLITPGLSLMKTCLAQGTKNLDLVTRQHVIGLADNTAAGIYNGTLLAIVSLIEHVILNNPGFQLILTGGDAEIVAEQLTMAFNIQPNLVLQGLAVAINSEQTQIR